MKDEIKEILEALRDSIDDTGTDKVNFINWVDKIENYITTLQKENARLKVELNDLKPLKEAREQTIEYIRRKNGEI